MSYDIHTHILPFIDDGPATPVAAEALLASEARAQIYGVAFTPHFYSDSMPLETFVQKRERAYGVIRQYGLLHGFTFSVASETSFSSTLFRYEDVSALCYEGTRYLLTELSFDKKWRAEIITGIERLVGYYQVIPVIAHPERYPALQKDFALAEALWECGCVFQINAAAFFSRVPRKTAKKLLERGYPCCLASDCHNMITRPPGLANGYAYVERQYGKGAADMLRVQAAHIFCGK